MRKAMITGLAGLQLRPDERAFLREAQPAGLIIFARNIESPDQLRRLVGEAREAIGASDSLVLVDQEGGRVQRLGPPHWRAYPDAWSFGVRWAADQAGAERAAEIIAQLMAADLRELGINVNCVPCADRPVPGGHEIIGSRAYGSDNEPIIRLAGIVADAHMAMGVVPVIKHVPGHGRAEVDSHLALPVVETTLDELRLTDFVPFRALHALPAAMTAHVVYTALDTSGPATTSARVISNVIRVELGFDGLLISDDLSMQALQGGLGGRAAAAIAAGCDLALHCNGDLGEMEAVAAAVPDLEDEAAERFAACIAVTERTPFPLDTAAAEAVLSEHMHAMAADRAIVR